MQKLNLLLEKNVGYIAICLGVIGIVTHTFYALNQSEGIFANLGIIYVDDSMRELFDIDSKFNIPSILLLLMLTVGGIAYKVSKGMDSRLLRFGFSIVAAANILRILFSGLYYFLNKTIMDAEGFAGDPIKGIDYIFPIVIALSLIYISIYLTRCLVKKQAFTFQRIENRPDEYVFDDVSIFKRASHLFLDLFFMFLLLWTSFLGYLMAAGRYYSFLDFTNTQLGFNLFVGFTVAAYYLLFEGLFGSTPMKFLTGTRVVNVKTAETPSFGTILIRTLCRAIPFEFLSFLFGKRGWHDSYSGTLVVQENREGQINFRLPYLLLLFIGAFIGINIFSGINQNNQKNRYLDDRKNLHEIADNFRKSIYNKTINEGDLLLLRDQSESDKAAQDIVLVEAISNSEISGTRYSIMEFKNRTNRRVYFQRGIIEDWIKRGQVIIDNSELNNALSNDSPEKIINVNGNPFLVNEIINVASPVFEYKNLLHDKKRNSELGQAHGAWELHLSYTNNKYVEILGVETIEGNVKWTSILPLKTEFDPSSKNGIFKLKLEESDQELTKSKMRILCDGKEIEYYIFRHGKTVRIV